MEGKTMEEKLDPSFDPSQYQVELEHAIGYSSIQQGLFFHPSSNEFIYSTGATVVVRSFQDPHQQHFLRGHQHDINCLTISSHGTFLASGENGIDSDIVIWDFKEKKELWRFSEHDGGICSLSISHDERLLLSVGYDNRLVIWDLKTGMIVCSTDLPKIIGEVSCTSWGGYAKDVKRRDTDVYQFATGDAYNGHINLEMADCRRNVRKATCVCFLTAPDSAGRDGYYDEWLIAGTESGDFVSYLVKPSRQVGGVAKATFVSATPTCAGGVVSIVSSSGQSPIVAVGGGDGTVALFRYVAQDSTWVDEAGTSVYGAVCSVDLSKDEILIGTRNGDILKSTLGFSLNSGDVTIICKNHCSSITAVAYAPGSNTDLATACSDGTIRVWSADDYSVKTEIRIRQNQSTLAIPTCLVFTVDAIMTGWTDSCVRCHHAITGKLLWTIENAHIGGVTALALSHNLKFFLTGGKDGGVRMWEMRTRDLVNILKEHSREITEIVIFKEDVYAMTASKDKSFLCWDLRQEKRISAHTQRMGGINALTLNHDQSLVMTVGQERNITFWDLRQPFPVNAVCHPEEGMHLDEATALATSHSGNMFATGGMDSIVKLWILDGRTPKLIQSNIGHSGPINSLAFSADDRQLVSVGPDGNIIFWNIFKPI